MLRKNLFSQTVFINLIYLLFVICFGAYVRMTGSGAGCGNHWPLCNGDVIPRTPILQTVIEYSHRITSGFLLIFSLILCYLSVKFFPKKHFIRFLCFLYLGLLIVESLLGAFLVIFEHVAQNKSVYRAFSTSFHLINTFLLVLVAGGILYFSKYKTIVLKTIPRARRVLLLVGGILFIVVGLSGAITALGDTLFPVDRVWDAILRSQSTAEHLFVRLRVYHPFFAIFTALYIIFVCCFLKNSINYKTKLFAQFTIILFVFQIFLGYLNIYFHAPYLIQIIHLFCALLTWLSYCGFCATHLVMSNYSTKE